MQIDRIERLFVTGASEAVRVLLCRAYANACTHPIARPRLLSVTSMLLSLMLPPLSTTGVVHQKSIATAVANTAVMLLQQRTQVRHESRSGLSSPAFRQCRRWRARTKRARTVCALVYWAYESWISALSIQPSHCYLFRCALVHLIRLLMKTITVTGHTAMGRCWSTAVGA